MIVNYKKTITYYYVNDKILVEIWIFTADDLDWINPHSHFRFFSTHLHNIFPVHLSISDSQIFLHFLYLPSLNLNHIILCSNLIFFFVVITLYRILFFAYFTSYISMTSLSSSCPRFF